MILDLLPEHTAEQIKPVDAVIQYGTNLPL